MLMQIYKNQKLFEKYWGERSNKQCGYSGLRTLKLAVFQERISRIN